MVTKRTLSASAFKARCLALMDEVAQTGEPVLITKNGKPIAQLTPAPQLARSSLFGLHKGKVHPLGDVDLDEPIADPEDWTGDAGNLGDER